MLFGFLSCDNKPLLTELIDNKMTVIIKGTYESNGPTASWVATTPTKFYLDIAQMSFDNDIFGHYRETYEFRLSDNSEDFFNGTGVTFKNDDLYNGKNYSKLKVYFRKMIFNAATDGGSVVETTFNEKEINGFDFNEYQAYTQADYDDYENDGSSLDNLVFPARYKLPESFEYERDKEFVLEVRIFVKNNIEEYTGMDSDLPDSFYAFNDSINACNGTGNKYIGGNLRIVARIYRTDQIANHSAAAGAANVYVCAIPTTDNIGNYTVNIPQLVTFTTTGTYFLNNIPTGKSYTVYRSASDPSAGAMAWTPTGETINL